MASTILEAKNISVQFGNFVAVSDVSIAVASNSIHALIGPNGAGKTTLFNALTGVRRPSSGRIVFDARDVTKASAHRRVRFGMTRSFQVTNLFPSLSVQENLRLAIQARHRHEGWVFWRRPYRREIARDVERILARVGIESHASVLAGNLSHGGQRLLEVGMALAGLPKLICLDEPLAGMGIDDVHKTKELLLSLRDDMSVLLIEHNMGVVLGISDCITVMAQGKKIAEGRPETVRQDPAVKIAYLGSAL
jgi:branched-chain amino acid transport system ATP-binding protein